jgi:uncharacterized sulfatase
MHRLTILLAFAVAFSAAASAEAQEAGPDQPQAQDRPNILLIISDDQSWTDFGFMGHPHVRTPNLDELAEQSLTYTRGYVPTALCRPSLMTMVTGLYPHQHKTVGNDPVRPGAGTDATYKQRRAEAIAHIDAVPTLPELLKKQGYLSLQTGKWWEGSYERGGFTHGMTRGFPEPGGRHGDDGLDIGRKGLDPIYNFIDTAQAKDKPFFVWYAPFLPHTPHNPPKELLEYYRDKTDSIHLAKYWAMCEWFDRTCGRLLDHLDEQGVAEDTIVLFVTDNGWIQRRNSGGFAPRSKRSAYEMGIRTPMMVRWPGHVEPARDTQNLASSIDLAPTILNAAGLEPTDRMRGIDLTDRDAMQNRERIFGASYTHDFHIDQPAKNVRRRWVIDGSWKLLMPNPRKLSNAEPELYNLEDDPHEKRNLSSKHPGRVKRLKQRLNDWWNPAANLNGRDKQ